MTNDLISREALLGKAITVTEIDEGGWERVLRAVPVEEIEAAEAVDAKPVVRCGDCAYWLDRHVLLADGTRRPYEPGEDNVTADVGINCGARCMLDADYMGGNGPFRQKEDFCSRGAKMDGGEDDVP